MARNKAPQDIRRRREQWQQQKTRKAPMPKRKWWRIPLEIVGALGAIAGVLTLIPRVELVVTGSLDPSAPMKTIFSIENQSLLPIHDIDVLCGINEVANRFGGGVGNIGF